MELLQKEMHYVIEFITNEATSKNKIAPKYEDAVTVFFLLKIAMIEDKLNKLIDEVKPIDIKN